MDLPGLPALKEATKGPFSKKALLFFTPRFFLYPPRIRWRMQQGCSLRAPMVGLLPPLLLSSAGDHGPRRPSHTLLWVHHLPLQGIPVLPSSGQDFSHMSEFLPCFILTVPHITLHRSSWTKYKHAARGKT